jgi:serine O-acetyltransferase
MDLITLFLVLCGVFLFLRVVFSNEIKAAKERDPAAKGSIQILLLYSGVHALIAHRISHLLWNLHIPFIPRAISQLARFFTQIEIHPGARIGKGLFIDHGTGVVIGETAIVGNNVTLFQGVTLGGTGKETGKRHPTLGDNVVVGAGAKILGNILVGENSYVGANAVVIRNVPVNSTVVGVPAHIAKQDGKKMDLTLDHIHVSDPIMSHIKQLLIRIKSLEDRLGDQDDKSRDLEAE